MEQVYTTAIIVGGFVIVLIAVSFIFRNRLTKGQLSISREKVEGSLENDPSAQAEVQSDPKQSIQAQRGKTVIERVKSFWSRIRAPRDADLKVRDTTMLGSELDIYTPNHDDVKKPKKTKSNKSSKKKSKKAG